MLFWEQMFAKGMTAMPDTEPAVRGADNTDVYTEQVPGEVRVSVRALVEFLLRSGDIDNRRQASPEKAMQEGGRIHRMIQGRMGAEYRAEVPLRFTLPTDRYTLIVEGRADGIIEDGSGVTIDEIKGTYRDVDRMKAPLQLHLAQAKCYAYIYGLQRGLTDVRIRMTYCNLEKENIRYFYEDYRFQELETWFLGLISDYRKWADFTWDWRQQRQRSIARMEFPFDYREGQRELVAHVYRTIYHKRKLFLEAPTGVGKTISTIFPALKAMGSGMGEKLFYLTAKTVTRTVADDTIELLRGQGLRFKSVILTAKEKICFAGETQCNPENCSYARGHFDRINDAMYDLLTHEDRFTREKITEYARAHRVCPFEFCLDMSLFADGIICDYNYLFDPSVYLRRFFADSGSGEYLFLIDEAHNLVDRGREMYSAVLVKEKLLLLKREIQQTILSEREARSRGKQIAGQLSIESFLDMTDNPTAEVTEELTSYVTNVSSGYSGHSVFLRKGYAEKLLNRLESCDRELQALKREGTACRVIESADGAVKAAQRLYAALGDYFDEQEETHLPVRDALTECYFDLAHFLDIYERLDENYLKYTRMEEDGSFCLKLYCVNPAGNLRECMARGRSSILFSATFLPIQYYKGLLGGGQEDYEVYAESVFQEEKRALFIASDVTSRYTRRDEDEYRRIARYIHETVRNRHGNYLVFFPSYRFLETVYELYRTEYAAEDQECLVQRESMNEEEREAFLARFRGNEGLDLGAGISMEIEEDDLTLIGFCVLGGIFGEGIDLRADSLIGVIIVGTGLPGVCDERELLKGYFDGRQENGFDIAYRYPGMNKVLQAAGRVIRTAEDVGIIVLLDERFLQYTYRRLFPREWEHFETVTVDTIAKRVERFWDAWL